MSALRDPGAPDRARAAELSPHVPTVWDAVSLERSIELASSPHVADASDPLAFDYSSDLFIRQIGIVITIASRSCGSMPSALGTYQLSRRQTHKPRCLQRDRGAMRAAYRCGGSCSSRPCRRADASSSPPLAKPLSGRQPPSRARPPRKRQLRSPQPEQAWLLRSRPCHRYYRSISAKLLILKPNLRRSPLATPALCAQSQP